MNELNPLLLRRTVEAALAEDVGPGDVTTLSTVAPERSGRGLFIAKQPGILCGIPAMTEVFRTLDPDSNVSSIRRDGDRIETGDVLAEVKGRARSILTGERLALNFLQRLSGIATLTGKLAAAVSGTGARIVDTRKTTPGLRFLEKYAVRIGGGRNHRFSLADAVLIKDNHIVAAGGIGEAVKKARAFVPHTMTVEVEAETERQVREALDAGADIVMLDNMSPATMRRMVALIAGKALVEASGNISEETVRAAAESGVDIISIGALTHSAPALDIGLDLEIPE